MSEHSIISAKSATTTPAAAKNVMPVQEQLQNGNDLHSFQKLSIQCKLTIGAPDDSLEHEADAMADTIMRMPEQNFIQRKCDNCEEEEKVQRKPLASFIQKKGSQGGMVASDSVSNQINSSRGKGNPLSVATKSFMESCFGTDFSKVNIHTGGQAIEMNRDLNAKAFTVSNDIYFNKGQYNPGSSEGKHLLAHELTHVVQQGSLLQTKLIQRRGLGDGHDLSSPRFAGNADLEDAYDSNTGGIVISTGSSGMHITILQQALIDAGFPLAIHGVDGQFGSETETAVRAFQISQGLTGGSVNGRIETITMGLFDQYFLNHGTLAAIPNSANPANLTADTRTLNASEIVTVERARTTEVQAPIGGVLPTFHSTIPGHPDTYETRVENETNRIISLLFTNYGSGRRGQHTTPGGLHSWATIENIADVSKRETDRVYGNYATPSPAFRHGTNLFDAWHRKEQSYAAGGAAGAVYEQRRVEFRVNKIFSSKQIHDIDVEHGAVQSRPGGHERAILTVIRTRIIAARRAELIEIDHGWPGFADPPTSSVYVQLFTSPTAVANRDFMWRQFQILVHEYMHTLAHINYRTYYRSLPNMRGGKTYQEGMTDYFTKIVLESTIYNAALSSEVEGIFHDPAIIRSRPYYRGYPEAANAEAVVGVVGIRNAMAAFFHGRTDLIGGP